MKSVYSQKLRSIACWLNEHRELWTARPFIDLPVSWESKYPGMARELRNLTLDEAERYEATPWDILGMPEPFDNLLKTALKLSQWPLLAKCGKSQKRPPRVPGRKWAQVESFVDSVVERSNGETFSHVVDWCSGKGHLGRSLACALGKSVLCVEKDEALCRDGAAEAESLGVNVKFRCGDVLTDNMEDLFTRETAVVALHACGDLNRKLIKSAISGEVSFVAIAPCCYQRTSQALFTPMSEIGRKNLVELDKHQLRFVSFSENIAGVADKKLRRREQVFRLGFDLLQRDATGNNTYLPTGSVPTKWVRGTFENFCTKVAARAGVFLSEKTNFAFLEKAGEDRLRVVHALGIVRGIFRRPLESLLLLDRGLALEESGYRVTLGVFCDLDITPRNLMIMANRRQCSSFHI